MRSTIFTRILFATVMPAILIFSLVAFAIANHIYDGGTGHLQKTAVLISDQIAERITEKLVGMNSMIEQTARDLARLDWNHRSSVLAAEQSLISLLASDPDLSGAWAAFEPGIGPDGDRFITTLAQAAGRRVRTGEITPEQLAHPWQSSWYFRPLTTGRPFLNMTDSRPYGRGERNLSSLTLSHPIRFEERIAGAVGADLAYTSIRPKSLPTIEGRYRLLLLNKEGFIIHAEDYQEIGRHLFDGTPYAPPEFLELPLNPQPYIKEMVSPYYQTWALICIYPIDTGIFGLPVYLFMDIPTEDLYAEAKATLRLIALTSLAGLAFLTLGVFIAARNISRPLKSLTRDFQKVTRGDLNIDDASLAEDEALAGQPTLEMDILKSALHKMLSQIHLTHDLELKSAEAKVEQERLLNASLAKTRFFANMSHEIRTPMNAILGISEILLHDGHLTEWQRKYVNDIKVSSDSLLTIINDILDLSKLESGRMALMPVNYDFHTLIDNVASLARYLARQKELAFELTQEGELPRCLYGDDVRLRQVLLNLLSNAVKFTDQGQVGLWVADRPEGLVFRVSDTGAGLKMTDLPALFEPFGQADPNRRRRAKGTGLGLPICKSLVELMGGTIEVESRHGHGSTFTVTIPRLLGDETALGEPPEETETTYAPETSILVVDDNEINLGVAAGLLKTLYNLDSDLAASAREALEMVRKKEYDLIFMDHMMPELDGVAATRLVRALGGRHLETPIIALTANAVTGIREMLLEAGLNDFLAKPVRKEELAVILHKWLPERLRRGGRPVSPGRAPAGPRVRLERAATLSELDVAVGLAASAGRKEVYERLLFITRDKLPGRIIRMAELVDQGRLEELAIETHGLKSGLASIGALPLSRQARSLETAARVGDREYCREHLPFFLTRLKALAGELALIYRDPAPADESQTREQGTRTILNAAGTSLAQALEIHDHEALRETLEYLADLDFGPEINSLVLGLKSSLTVFDYDQIESLLKSWPANQPEPEADPA